MTAAVTDPVAMQDSDAEVIQRSLQEPERFGTVFDRYYLQIHSYAARRLGSSHADDVAANTFLIAFSRRERYALASMPEVTNLGEMAGGLGLQISLDPPAADKYADGEVPEGADRITLVIDPATATLLSMAYADTTTTIHATEWTDQAPPTQP